MTEPQARHIDSLTYQLNESEENLRLIDERISQYVQAIDVPLQLIKERRRLQIKVRRLKRQIAEQKPVVALRLATKLITGPVAELIRGEQWIGLRQTLLTQASKLPRETYLDVDYLEERADVMMRLCHEIQVLFMAYRIEPNSGQVEALRQHCRTLAADLIRINLLPPGAAPQLEALAQGTLSI